MNKQLYKTRYDRSKCDIGWVHIGFGAFHRAHQALYIDDYMQATGDLRWGIAAVNLHARDQSQFAEASALQDGYLLKSIPPVGDADYRVVRSHIVFKDATLNREGAVALFAEKSVFVMSITVTESSYYFAEDWTLDKSAPHIASELKGESASTIYSFLEEAMEVRALNNAAITVLCCDNIRANGDKLRNAFLAYLKAKNKHTLAKWVSNNATFPCSMVDRITPKATQRFN